MGTFSSCKTAPLNMVLQLLMSLFLLSQGALAAEVTEPFTPGGCVNEYITQYAFDTVGGFEVLQVGVEVQAPQYEHGEEQPELTIVLWRRSPLPNESTEAEEEGKRSKISEWDTRQLYRNLVMTRQLFGVDVASEATTVPSGSSSSSSSPSVNSTSSDGGVFKGDTLGEWVIADASFECPVAAKRFKCVKNYYKDDFAPTSKDQFKMVISSDGVHPEPVCMVFHLVGLGKVGQYQHYIAAVIFILVFVILAFEMVSRALVTMLGDVILFGLLWAFQAQPTLEAVMSWLDWRTMVLLTSMMMAVAIFAETGFFEWSAWMVLKMSRKYLSRLSLTVRKWIILLLMGAMTFTASAFLDNCTTVLLFAPVTVQMAQLLEADPMPLLMTMIYFCTLGGATTYVGDPPNLIIGGQFEIGFNPFILNCAPPVFIVLGPGILVMWLQFHYRMKTVVKEAPPPEPSHDEEGGSEEKPVADVQIQGEEGEPPVDQPPPESPGRSGHAATVNEQEPTGEEATTEIPLVERHVDSGAMEEGEEMGSSSVSAEEEERARKEAEMDAEYRIRDKKTFWKSVGMLGLMLVFFLLESVTMVSTTWVAVVGSGILLLITSPRQIAPILEKIEWPTLFFFAYLFIFVKLIEKLGVIFWISEIVVGIIEAFPVESRLPVAMMAILWMSALLACWCNNIAFTASIIPLIYFIANKPGLGVPLRPLAWSLALGVAMSANATVIAAAPNLIVAQIAGRAGYKISFLRFMMWGFPFMLFTTSITAAYLLIVYWLMGFPG